MEKKQLNENDFEALGWKKTYINKTNFFKEFTFWVIDDMWSLYWFEESPLIISIDRGKYPNQIQFFRGTIKNKSELKKLMKQLGINGEERNKNSN